MLRTTAFAARKAFGASTIASRTVFTKLGEMDDFDAILKKGNVLVQFSASWCGPCRSISPKVKELAADPNVNVVYVDIDDHQELAGDFDVSSVPYFIGFKDGKQQGKVMGANFDAIKGLVAKLN